MPKKGGSKHYVYASDNNFSSINLCDDGTFTQSNRGCTFSFICKGHWTQHNDTIFLQQEKFKKTRGQFELEASRSAQLLVVNDSSLIYLWNRQMGLGDGFVMKLR